MRNSALFMSFIVAAVLSGCGMIRQDVTRSNTDTFSFTQNAHSAVVEGQALSLNRMAEQLVQRSVGYSVAQQQVEPVSASELVLSLRDMNGQMSALQIGLPELLAQQDAELADLQRRHKVRAITRKNYEEGLLEIQESRAIIADALSVTALQTERASQNMTAAMAEGQSGLDWHLGATNQLARDMEEARSTISLLILDSFTSNDRVALTVAPRSGELR